LAWLIDPELEQVHIYRLGTDVEVLKRPDSVSADPELPEFILDLREIWEPT
jgi:Uma2 family endonuclease